MVLRPWPKTAAPRAGRHHHRGRGGPGGRSDHKTVTEHSAHATLSLPRHQRGRRDRQGEITALHEADLQAQLRASGLSLIRFSTVRRRALRLASLPTRELINLLFHMQMLLRGVPLIGALRDLRDGADSLELRQVAASLMDRIQNGSTLADAMAQDPGIFTDVMVHLVRSGEVTGQLAEVMGELVRSLKWQAELAAQTKKLLMYPAFVTVTISGVVVFLMVYLVPQLVSFIRNMGQEIPLQTRLLIWLSEAFVGYWWLILPAPVALVVGVALAARANEQLRFAAPGGAGHSGGGAGHQKIILARLMDSFAHVPHRHPGDRGAGLLRKITSNLPVQRAWRARSALPTVPPSAIPLPWRTSSLARGAHAARGRGHGCAG